MLQTPEITKALSDMGIDPAPQGAAEFEAFIRDEIARSDQIISQVMGNNTALRSRIFRRELGELLRMAWAICAQHMTGDLKFYFDSQVGQLDEAALKASYAIEPNGSGDTSNRPLQIQKAYSRLQAFSGSPYVDQAELTKSALEVDDPRIVRRLFREPEQKADAHGDQRVAHRTGRHGPGGAAADGGGGRGGGTRGS